MCPLSLDGPDMSVIGGMVCHVIINRADGKNIRGLNDLVGRIVLVCNGIHN